MKPLAFVFLALLVIVTIAVIGYLLLNRAPTASASLAPRDQLLQQIKELPGEGVLLGQQLAYGEGNDWTEQQRYFDRIAARAGAQPAMIGMDYWRTDLTLALSIEEGNRRCLQWWNNGGLCTISIHMRNPFVANGEADAGTVNDLTGSERLLELTSRDTEAGARFHAWLDVIAAGLQELKDAGVIVLWRPFHEMNGGWFWWTPPRGFEEDYQTLWRYLHDYLTIEQGFDHLIWVYSAAAAAPVLPYFPGMDYVDVTGIDYYRELEEEHIDLNRADEYEDLLSLGLPVYLTEFGGRPASGEGWDTYQFDNVLLLRDLKELYPEIFAVHFWESVHQFGFGNNVNHMTFAHDPYIVTLDSLTASGVMAGTQAEDVPGVVSREDYIAVQEELEQERQRRQEMENRLNALEAELTPEATAEGNS